MTQITLSPTIPLSDYAKNHLEDLGFTPNEVLTPNITGTFERREPNFFGRAIKKIENSSSIIVKLAGQIVKLILIFSLIGIPLAILWIKETKKLDQDAGNLKLAINELNDKVLQINKRAELVEKLNIKDRFKNLPILNLGDRQGKTDYIDFLQPKELNHPIMKGIDCHNRPFIACKLSSKQGHSFVVTLFQRYTDQDTWTWGGNEAPPGFAPYSSRLISTESFDYFRQIINRQHPEYRLAN